MLFQLFIWKPCSQRLFGLYSPRIDVNDSYCICVLQGGYGTEVEQQYSCTQIVSSPPFFCGSPPSRVANPLIQDARFGDEKITPFSPLSPAPLLNGCSAASPSSSARKGGCVRANFGNKPAVRIEGFDCLDRDQRNCSIPALAQSPQQLNQKQQSTQLRQKKY